MTSLGMNMVSRDMIEIDILRDVIKNIKFTYVPKVDITDIIAKLKDKMTPELCERLDRLYDEVQNLLKEDDKKTTEDQEISAFEKLGEDIAFALETMVKFVELYSMGFQLLVIRTLFCDEK